MRNLFISLTIILIIAGFSMAGGIRDLRKGKYVIVIHGGAGTITPERMTKELEIAYTDALSDALAAGEKILKDGGSASDAVEAAIKVMEDSPLFNAGKGAVFTNDGKNELDASFMDGKTKNAGAVAGVNTIKNPISAARKVMSESEHVMLVGDGAEAFAKTQGLEIVDPSYFHTELRWEQLEKVRGEAEDVKLDHDVLVDDKKFGTVGCVALDMDGNLAAGTSTGGMTNKKWGRVGDSPIIGAGTYADNKTCAVSCTGHGEYFIRYVVAYDVAARMAYGNQTLAESSNEVIYGDLFRAGGKGGLIAVDGEGNIAMPFNTAGMYRGYVKSGEQPVVKFYKE